MNAERPATEGGPNQGDTGYLTPSATKSLHVETVGESAEARGIDPATFDEVAATAVERRTDFANNPIDAEEVAAAVGPEIFGRPTARGSSSQASRDAGRIAKSTQYRIAPDLLAVYRRFGPHTDQECWLRLVAMADDGKEPNAGTVQKARLAEERAGLLVATGMHRPNTSGAPAMVYRALAPSEPGFGVRTEPRRRKKMTDPAQALLASGAVEVVAASDCTIEARCLDRSTGAIVTTECESGECSCTCGEAQCVHAQALRKVAPCLPK